MFGEQTLHQIPEGATSQVSHVQPLSAAIPDALYMLDNRESPSTTVTSWPPGDFTGDTESGT